MITWLLGMLSVLFFIQVAAAEEPPPSSDERLSLKVFGYVSEEPTYVAARGTLVNPNFQLFSVPEWRNRAFLNLNAALAGGPFRLVAKVRPTVQTIGDDTEVRGLVDDLYVDTRLGSRGFLTVGMKNYRQGVGLSFNPTDFLAERKEQDFSEREEERRANREGNIVGAVDLFFANASLSAIAAPHVPGPQGDETRAVLKGAAVFEDIKLDASVVGFYGDRPGLGLNLSKAIGDQLEVHVEGANRWGSARKLVRRAVDPIAGTRPAQFDIRERAGRDETFTDAVVGASYTFRDGTNVIGEYYHVGDGYSEAEWRRVLDLIEVRRAEFAQGTFRDLARGGLADANDMITFRTLRRHYLFLRAHNAQLLSSLDASVAVLFNAEDQSFVVSPIIDFTRVTNMTIGVSAMVLEGRRDSEFGLSPVEMSVTLRLRYFF